ncbi:MAG: hypothetical protein A2W35_02260 [Chloroflexi bacterium RBG_16_57_11]|nr:MAG: hypothetical protein A2W35_02260 [Chloroflexi bacterium RBG_16_57_11]
MSSSQPSADNSYSEVTNISVSGFWFIVDNQEYFVPFADYPGFRDATVTQIYAVQRLSDRQLHWPELDIDIELDALDHPDQYPLVFRP